MNQRIYIIEFCPQGSDRTIQAQTVRPFSDLMECAAQYRKGICKASVRPLMMNGRFVVYSDGRKTVI